MDGDDAGYYDGNGRIDDDGPQRGRWWYVLLFPLLIVLASLHCLLCIMLQVFFRTEKRRREIYEYYAPWGFGDRIDFNNI